jgi:putative membrane protein
MRQLSSHFPSALLIAFSLICADPSGFVRAEDDRDFDSTFMKDSCQRVLGEIELCRLVEKKSAADGVKHYADLQIKAYRPLLEQLREAARDRDIKVPTDLSDHQQDAKRRLETVKGAEFDHHFLSDQLDEQQSLINLFERASRDCQDKRLRDLASKNLDELRDRYKLAKELYNKIKENRTDGR